jgi:hypothetical protein
LEEVVDVLAKLAPACEVTTKPPGSAVAAKVKSVKGDAGLGDEPERGVRSD